jgi:hypothetical protein
MASVEGGSTPVTRRLDWNFFQNLLTPLVVEWRTQRNLKPPEAVVTLRTTRGAAFKVDAIRVAPTWIAVFTESDELHFVPMDEVALVTIERRPAPAPEKVVGFHQDPSVDVGD